MRETTRTLALTINCIYYFVVTTATSEDGSSSNRSSAADASTSAVHQARPPSEANVGHDYQTMDSRLNSFRPADMGNVRPDVQKRSLPSVPPMLPSDPGYARPFVSGRFTNLIYLRLLFCKKSLLWRQINAPSVREKKF